MSGRVLLSHRGYTSLEAKLNYEQLNELCPLLLYRLAINPCQDDAEAGYILRAGAAGEEHNSTHEEHTNCKYLDRY